MKVKRIIISLTRIGHAALDLLGIIPRFEGCDGINAVWYLSKETMQTQPPVQ